MASDTLFKIVYIISLNNLYGLCRPGRMEFQIEIGLPDEEGRVQILGIHSNRMKEKSFLGADVDLESLGMHSCFLEVNMLLVDEVYQWCIIACCIPACRYIFVYLVDIVSLLSGII